MVDRAVVHRRPVTGIVACARVLLQQLLLITAVRRILKATSGLGFSLAILAIFLFALSAALVRRAGSWGQGREGVLASGGVNVCTHSLALPQCALVVTVRGHRRQSTPIATTNIFKSRIIAAKRNQ